MSLWPFRRKSSRKRKNSGSEAPTPAPAMRSGGQQGDHGRSEVSPPGAERRGSGKATRNNRKSRRESKKLQRDPEKRTYSFSPGRNDSIRVPKDIHRQHPVPPLPSKPLTGSNSAKDGRTGKGRSASHNDAQDWQRIPTLHKRSAQDLPRRKSSKKRKEDHNREAEIRAMSASMPSRAATEYGLMGRPMKKESKKMRSGLGRDLTNPSSDISLPLAESIHSSMSSDSEKHASYELKGIDVFSPRPTIRLSENPRYVSGSLGSDRSDSRRRPSDRTPIPEETLKANKRIDDLADDLDSGSLRELMERDQRRRDRKKALAVAKMARKLAKKVEQQKAAEAEAVANGTEPPKNMDRGVLGREVMGSDADATSPIKRKASDASSKRREKRPTELTRDESAASGPDPLGVFHRSSSLGPTEAGSPSDEREKPVLGTAQLGKLSRASMSPPASPKGHKRGASSISQMMELSKAQTAVEKPEPKAIRHSSEASTRPHQFWTSFFKRSSKAKRNSVPTSFSNTSRDSTVTPQPPTVTYAPRASLSSGIPKRTMSRFREDLPEFPLSPPDSRVQSPETDAVPPISTRDLEKREDGQGSAESPLSGQPASRVREETPTSGQRSNLPSPEPSAVMSQSLASIDSEGSWLSGRPRAGSKRSSAQAPAHHSRDSASSLQRRYKEYSESQEELGIAEDEYFSRLTPGPEDGFGERRQRRASGHPMPSSDEEDNESAASPGETKWGAVGRHPTVIHHQPRAKSREGLLNEYQYDSVSEGPEDTPQESNPDRKSYGFGEPVLSEPTVSRATSVDLGKRHVRHISAGSARLVDLKPRASAESKRRSTDVPIDV